MIKLFVFISVLFVVNACNNYGDKQACNHHDIQTEREPEGEVEIVDFYYKKGYVNSDIIEFSITSNCDDCSDLTGSVINNQQSGDTLFLSIGHFFNCAGGIYVKDYEFLGDTINIITGKELRIEIDEYGEEHKVHISASCLCYYEFDLIVKNISHHVVEILINGRRVDNCI